MKKQTQKQSTGNPKVFGCFGLFFATLAFLISFIPFIGAYGLGIGFFGVLFSGVTYHLYQKENKRLTLPIIGLALGISGFCMGGYQFYQYKYVFDGISEVNKKKDEALWKLTKHFFIKEDEGINKVLNEITPDRHNEYFISFVDNLRVRAQPNLKSEILGQLKYGDKALSLNEESSEKDSIEIGGAMRFSTWQKVQFPGQYLGDTITGWAYGGALIKPSIKKFQSSENIHFKTVFRESAFDVSKLIRLEVGERYTYHGIIQYKEFYKRDGPFRLVGFSKEGVSDLQEFRNKVEIRGTFYNDKLDGMLIKKHFEYETGTTTKIKFEKGKCVWFYEETDSEGEVSKFEDKSPKNCSLD